ncbi:MAG: hypothetical protein DRP64_02790 [Verrucomicrobia bacterium]|nr:MAG: hypothetical protein DRP64_02790 [Verrucomicrobiota bacterium]
MKISFAIITLFVLLTGCTNLSDKKIEQPFVISTIDVNEAYYVRDFLNATEGFKGTFNVNAGSTVTTVTFKSPDEPMDEEACRKWMRSIKAPLTEHRGREANTLKFVFKNVTLEE